MAMLLQRCVCSVDPSHGRTGGNQLLQGSHGKSHVASHTWHGMHGVKHALLNHVLVLDGLERK